MKSLQELSLSGHAEFRKALERLPQIDFNPAWTGKYLPELVSCKLFVKPVWFVDAPSGCRVLVIPVKGCGNMVVSEMYPDQSTAYALFVDCVKGLPTVGGRWGIELEDVRKKWNEDKAVTNSRLDTQYMLDLITTAEHKEGLTLE